MKFYQNFLVFDANPKIPVGILSGNYFQFGDYDLCMSINETVGSRQITGQYCSVFLMQDKTLPNKEVTTNQKAVKQIF